MLNGELIAAEPQCGMWSVECGMWNVEFINSSLNNSSSASPTIPHSTFLIQHSSYSPSILSDRVSGIIASML